MKLSVSKFSSSFNITICGVEVTDEYVENAFQWTRDSGDIEADAVWNAAHAGKKAITLTEADLNGDIKLTCTLTASSATYGSVTVDDNLDASHTPAELDANDVFVIENGDLKVTTSRGNAYILENNTLKASGAKLNGSITAESKLFASQPEDVVEFSYDHNGLRTQKKMTKADGTVETTDYTLHGKLITHLTRGEDEMHFFYDAQSRPAMVEFNGTLYSYAHNLQSDIVGILDSSGNLVVEYGYDAWGKPVVVRTLATAYDILAKLNPFRYRGYVYDEETELYYLRSRYYNVMSMRFINADMMVAERRKICHNVFSYAKCRPLNRCDREGRKDVIYTSHDEFTVENDNFFHNIFVGTHYYIEYEGTRYKANSYETVSLTDWTTLDIDFMETEFDSMLEEKAEYSSLESILQESIGGGT